MVKKDRSSVWAQYSILAKNRGDLVNELKSKGIPTAIYYPKPLHLQPAYQSLGYRNGDFPISEKTANQILSIPMHPYLSREDQDFIIEAINGATSWGVNKLMG